MSVEQYLFWDCDKLVGGGFYISDEVAIEQGKAYERHADKNVNKITEADTKRLVWPKLSVNFEYNESARQWDVFVIGATDDVEARQAFNAAVITSHQAIPTLEANKAVLQKNGSYQIWVGQIEVVILP